MNKDRQDIERIFQEAFRGYEESVSDAEWKVIEQSLPGERKRRKRLWPFLIPLPIAAALALLWLINNPEAEHSKHVQQILNRKGDTSEVSAAKNMKSTAGTESLRKLKSQGTSGYTEIKNTRESSAYRRTDTSVSRGVVESESQKYSGAGSNNLGGSTGQISNELREFQGKLPILSSKKYGKFETSHEKAAVNQLFSGKYRKAMDAWRSTRRPSFWISTSIQAFDIAAADVSNLEEWKGKSLTRKRLQGGLVQQVSAGITLNTGLTSIQVGMGESQTLNPLKQHWTLKTRMITDSIPYRNLPGDTLFWIPVRFTDTLVDIVSEFSERRLIIPFRMAQNIPICANFGLNFQLGGQLGILQSMKATIPSPYTDYTWTQVRSGMAGKALTNEPLASAGEDKAIRTRMDVQLGTGAYWRFSRNMMLSGNMLFSKSLNPLMQGSVKYRQYGGQVTLLYQW